MNEININVLNYNAVKVAEKLSAPGGDPASHIKFLNKFYATNGTQAEMEKVLDIMLDEGLENEIVPAGSPNILRLENEKGNEIPYTYYTHSATDTEDGHIMGIFVDYAANTKLMNSQNYGNFKIWFRSIVTAFFASKGYSVYWKTDIPDTGDKGHFDFNVE